MIRVLTWICAVILLSGLPHQSRAQRSGQLSPAQEGAGMTEHLGEQIPGEITLVDEEGETVRLEDFFHEDRPILVSLVYHNCPMLCNLMSDGLAASLDQMAWTPGDQFTVLSVSFNHREGPELARQQKTKYIEQLGRPDAADGWHFLTGSEEQIARLTEAVGFEFRWDEEKQQYAHPAVLAFLSPDGTITRYLYGLETPPRRMRNALVEAGEGTVGNVIDQAILYCFQYDPGENAYIAQAFNIMKLGGVLTLIVLGTTLMIFWRRERRSLEAQST